MKILGDIVSYLAVNPLEIEQAERAFNVDDAELGRILGGYTRNTINNYRRGKKTPGNAFNRAFRLWLETQPAPREDWTPDPSHVALKDVAGYLRQHTCPCGKVYWSPNRQRRHCMTCRPYEGETE